MINKVVTVNGGRMAHDGNFGNAGVPIISTVLPAIYKEPKIVPSLVRLCYADILYLEVSFC